MTTATRSQYPMRLGFAPATIAVADPDHPGLRRAGPRAAAPYGLERVETHVCPATDGAADTSVRPDLATCGFDVVDLSALDQMQAVLGEIRRSGRIGEEQAATIRSSLDGAVLDADGAGPMRVQYLAEEGLIMRTAGPNGRSVVGPRSTGMNDHGGATSVHADQDVYGTPMAQLLDGRAPTTFVHDSPDGHHHDGRLFLANLWIPLQQAVRPLVLADGRSIDRRRDQLRYGLATDSFLERDDEQVINDIWTFLHHDDQRWYFRSDMDHRSAYVFNTLSTAHGAGILPGEDLAEWCYQALEAAEEAAARGDAAGVAAAVSGPDRPGEPEVTTPALRGAIGELLEVLDEAAADPAGTCGERSDEWIERSKVARSGVVRMSIEMRMVVSIEDA
ncbi:hypothetical protein [Dermatobacter hominis]|uniref:hypothetical protein n=1 Tax=Dermatobacter hominis TaxID=2884263 RepID=UPI001D120F79|nr:hypothetical protein [Dermatobacter hominis]UDY36737.1 hypothetical protein LH044_04160 [Dermatobacter hominis]